MAENEVTSKNSTFHSSWENTFINKHSRAISMLMRYFSPKSKVGQIFVIILLHINLFTIRYTLTDPSIQIVAYFSAFLVEIVVLLCIPKSFKRMLFPKSGFDDSDKNKNATFMKLIEYLHECDDNIKRENNSIIERIDLLRISGMFSCIFFAFLSIRAFSPVFIIHAGVNMIVAFLCYVGYRVFYGKNDADDSSSDKISN